jgi:pyruvate dehydrogenase E1 component beta subunit
MEHKNLWPLEGEVSEGEFFPLGVARVVRTGSDVTLVSWSAQVHVCEAAAAALENDGINVELIDLRTLWPWDEAAVLASVSKTGKLIVAHEAVSVAGFGAEIAATVAEQTGARVKRLGAPRAPIGYAPPVEDAVRVTAPMIVAAVKAMVRA